MKGKQRRAIDVKRLTKKRKIWANKKEEEEEAIEFFDLKSKHTGWTTIVS
jgi:hypothetical protein